MNTVLIYNLGPEKEAKVKLVCRELFIDSKTVEKADYGLPISELLGLSEGAEPKEGEDFDDEMLYIAGPRGGMLNLLLDRLRRKKLTVPLKAVMTPVNLNFNSYELHKELSAEREAIAKGLEAH